MFSSNPADYINLYARFLREAERRGAAAEREACAKVAEQSADHTYEVHVGRVSKQIAQKIRSRPSSDSEREAREDVSGEMKTD